MIFALDTAPTEQQLNKYDMYIDIYIHRSSTVDLSRLGLALGVSLQEGLGFDGSCQRGRLTAEEEVSCGHHLASIWLDCK